MRSCCHVVRGIEERRWVPREREEDFVEHGRGDGRSLGARKRFFRAASRSKDTISKLKSSKRHIERVALHALLDVDELSGLLRLIVNKSRANGRLMHRSIDTAHRGVHQPSNEQHHTLNLLTARPFSTPCSLRTMYRRRVRPSWQAEFCSTPAAY
jgi:hypothetical protein